MKKLSIIVGVVLLLVVGAISLAGYHNDEVSLRNKFTQKITERTAFYDKMWKTINQKGQIAVKNDSSFQRNVQIIMENRKDAEGIMMKWVTESNPNANFSEVSKLYADLSRAVESNRDEFFEQEKMLQDIKLQHDNLMDKFPGTVVYSILGREKLVYKAITSDLTEEVMKTSKDNNTKVF